MHQSSKSIVRWAGSVLLLVACLFLTSAVFAAPTSVNLAGTIQNENGCGGDWDPSCTNTWLTAVTGTSSNYWRGVFIVPPGPQEYKIAFNGAWGGDLGYHG